jgi:hypothetical protein
MNVPLYGTKQAAYCFFKTFATHIKNVTYKQSKADPCLFYGWINVEMVVFVAWVDDVMVLGPPHLVEQVQRDLERAFTCKREGVLTEYVGSKLSITRDEKGRGTVKFTQPVLIKKLTDEYKVPDGPVSKTPAVAGQVLVKGDDDGTTTQDTTMYRSATATCMFMMQWSRPDIFNAVRGLARHMTAPREAHVRALKTLIKYVTHTENRGLVISPTDTWEPGYKFKIHGRSDSGYATNPDDRRSISGGRVFVNDVPISFRSVTQKIVTLSVTEAEIAAGVMVAQDMLYIYRLMESLELEVELPMVLEMDNSGAVDIANSWSVGGRTRHVDVRNNFLRELKDQGLLVIRHVSGESNDADIFTKNVTSAIFDRHIPKYVGHDEYLRVRDSSREAVRERNRPNSEEGK